MSDDTTRARSIAYGRLLIERGWASEEVVRALGERCLAEGSDLRGALIAQGIVSAARDAQVLAALAESSGAPPGPAPPPGTGEPLRPLRPRAGRVPGPGEVFAGCRVDREIARGGMGAVLAATAADGRPVALKVMLGGSAAGEGRARFEREAEIGEALRSPGLIEVYAHGEQDGAAYLVMELLEGARELHTFVAEEGVDLTGRLTLLVEVAQAVAAAHAAGIVHRDLKPANVLVTRAGQVKVVDFGLAKRLDAERLTQSNAVMGTIYYMAPEQVGGGSAHVDARADVFALGVMLYELVTTEMPFEAESSLLLMQQILMAEPRPLTKAVAGPLQPGLQGVLEVALAKEPAARYADAGAFAQDLVGALAGEGPSSQAASAVELRRQRRVRRTIPGLIGLAAALALGAWIGLRPEGPWDAERLELEATRLGAAAWGRLEDPRPLGEGAEGPQVLRAQLEVLREAAARSEAAGVGLPSGALEDAHDRVTALTGLVALARGELELAESQAAALRGSGVAAGALRGAVAAVVTGGDAQAGAEQLARAAARGAQARELVGWRVQAALRAGLASGLGAERGLAALAEAAGAAEPTPLELRLQARLLAELGRGDEARSALAALTDPDPVLCWRVGLTLAAAELSGSPDEAWGALSDLPSPAPKALAAERQALAEAALRVLRPLVTSLGKGGFSPPSVAALLQIVHRVRPEVPLPDSILDPLLDRATSVLAFPDLPLAMLLSKLVPAHPRVIETLRLLAFQRGISEESRVALFTRLEHSASQTQDRAQQVELLVSLCEGYAEFGTPDQVLATADRVLPLILRDELRGQVLGARARALLDLGDPEAALAEITLALELRDRVSFRRVRAGILHRLGRPERALDDVRVFFARSRPDATGALGMALVAYAGAQARGDFSLALEPLETAIQWRDPKERLELQVRLACVEVALGEVVDASDTVREARKNLRKKSRAAWSERLMALQATLAEDSAAAREVLEAMVGEFDQARATRGGRDE